MTDTAAALRRVLADELAEEGELRSPPWRSAVEAVPRERFLGEAVFRLDGGTDPWTRVRRDDVTEAEWLRMAYEDRTWVTQIDGVDAEEAPRATRGLPTSSSTLPSLVVGMLEDLDVRDGHRVLEIGTGTGYSTALLCHRLGDTHVASVEVDPGSAGRAGKALGSVGFEPDLFVHDGFNGDARGGSYDRIIATCSFRYVPQPWLYQVDTGSKILVTLAGWMRSQAQALLTVEEEGTAQGHFLPVDRSFMTARSHQPPPTGPIVFPGAGDDRPASFGPESFSSWTSTFIAQTAAPAAQIHRLQDQILFWDVSTGSQAWLRAGDDGGPVVRQHGPNPLWNAVEEALTVWGEAGSPPINEFGLTANPGGQRVWLGSPDGPSWRLPV